PCRRCGRRGSGGFRREVQDLAADVVRRLPACLLGEVPMAGRRRRVAWGGGAEGAAPGEA
ncbi:hypothetical protein AB4Z54_71425, partial [Streptomyces sp. MCAF7]